MEPNAPPVGATDEDLKSRFLAAAFDGSERSFAELRRDLAWHQETFDRIRELLAKEGRIRALSPEIKEQEEYREEQAQISTGLLTVGPRWFGRILNVTSVAAVPVSALGFACAGAFVAGTSVDAVLEGLGGKKGWTDVFSWSYPLLRVSAIGLVVGLVGVMCSAILEYVSARRQGATPGFFPVLWHFVGIVPRVLWGMLLVVLKLVAPGPPGSPPEKYIPVRADDPRRRR